MAYDPDGDPADFDPTNPDDVDAFLADPTASALVDDLGRAFRELPAAEQLPEVLEGLDRVREFRGQIAEMRDDPNTPPEVRTAVTARLDQLDSMVTTYEQRIAELRSQE